MVRNSDQIQENFSKFDVIGMARKCIWNICYTKFDERKILGNTSGEAKGPACPAGQDHKFPKITIFKILKN